MTGRLPEMHLFDFLHVDRQFSTQLLMTRDSGSGAPDSSINRFGTIVLRLTVSSELSKRQLQIPGREQIGVFRFGDWNTLDEDF